MLKLLQAGETQAKVKKHALGFDSLFCPCRLTEYLIHEFCLFYIQRQGFMGQSQDVHSQQAKQERANHEKSI